MWSRRAVLAALLFAPALACAGTPVEWRTGTEASGAGAVKAVRTGGRAVSVKLGAKLALRAVTITSRANDNARFAMFATFPFHKDADTFVKLNGTWYQASSYGASGTTESDASWDLDRATAQQFATALGIPLGERTELGQGLQARWTIPARASTRPGDPITIKLEVTNKGTAVVGFVIGGRQRGPRDNRFSFAIARNGQKVPIKDAPDFGGIMVYKALKPGDSTEVTTDLRAWADLDAPGHYEVDARYDGELVKDGVMPSTAAEQKNLWDLPLTGQGGILVQ